MSTSQAIHEQASEHKRLLSALEELDYVPVALAQQTEYLKDLEQRLEDSIINTEYLTRKVDKERKDHEEIRDSTFRRLAHKLTGKGDQYTEQAQKEEREYVEALEQQILEKEQQAELRRVLTEAKRIKKDLERKSSVATSLKIELNRLYNRVFEGPSPEFPEEDRLENEVWEAQKAHDQFQETVNAESRAAELLARADEHLAGCSRKLSSHFGVNHSDDYVAERKLLKTAQSLARNADTLIRQAQNISPQVKHIIRPTSTSLMNELLLDSLPTGHYNKRIKASTAAVNQVLVFLRIQQRAARQRAEDAGNKLTGAQHKLNRARDALYEFRKQTFQTVTTQDRPPSYFPPHPDDSLPAPPPAFPEPETNAPESDPLSEGLTSPLAPSWGSRNPYAALLLVHASSTSLREAIDVDNNVSQPSSHP